MKKFSPFSLFMLRSLSLLMQFVLQQVICCLIKKNKTKHKKTPNKTEKKKKRRKENAAHVSRQGNDTHPSPFSSKQTAPEELLESQLPEES